MRIFLIALLAAISYAQTDLEKAVGAPDGFYVHCSDKLLAILKSGAFKSTNKQMQNLGLSLEEARQMPAIAASLTTLFIKVGANGAAGTLGHALGRLKNTSGAGKITGCLIFSDPASMITDRDDDGYPGAFGLEIPFSSDGADGSSIALQGAFFHEACQDPTGPGKNAGECVTSKEFRALMENYTPIKMNWDQDEGPGAAFSKKAAEYITANFPKPTRVGSSPKTNFVPTKFMIVVSCVFILLLGSVAVFQKQHNNSYVQLLDADEV